MSGVDVEAFLDRLRGIAADWQSAHDDLAAMRVERASAGGLATCAANADGEIVALRLAADARDHPAEAVAAAVLEAGAAAVSEANARRAALVSHAVGLALD